uniref:Uncharacterized protein n=1 Tax=Beihai levi-like virus 20 TaxID=1922406 RepID=A0A1L3KI10_9VIRU|nr:hypothetical protein [Beihai levi-like virus 20]
MSLALQRSDATGETYALSSNPDYSVRFKRSDAPKSLDGNIVKNHATEIIVNDLNMVTIGDDSVPEALSVRLRVSGSKYSAVRLRELLVALSADLATWSDDGVFVGFRPSTVTETVTLP